MKTRLAIFISALLLLPLVGLFLSGAQWSNLLVSWPAEDESSAATLRTSMMLLIYALIVNHTIKRLTGNAPFDLQRDYFIMACIGSALMGWLLSYLNVFVASWTAPQDHPLLVQFLLYTPLFALLAPAVLVTRVLLNSLPAPMQALACGPTLPALHRQTTANILTALALTGLIGGAAWPLKLYWLLWASPLLLLTSLQLRWQQSTIFSTLKSGDWRQSVGAALSGIAVGNLAVVTYQSNAALTINLPSMLLTQAGFALFGLLCLQLGELLNNRQPVADQTLIPNKI